MTIKEFVEQLRAMDTYRVDVDSDGDLSYERQPNADWINAFSLECLIDEFEKSQ
jgi:hypothetical protein